MPYAFTRNSPISNTQRPCAKPFSITTTTFKKLQSTLTKAKVYRSNSNFEVEKYTNRLSGVSVGLIIVIVIGLFFVFVFLFLLRQARFRTLDYLEILLLRSRFPLGYVVDSGF